MNDLERFVGHATSWHNFMDNKLENPPDFKPTICYTCDKVIRMNSEGYLKAGPEKMCNSCYPDAPKNGITHLMRPTCLFCLKEERAGRKSGHHHHHDRIDIEIS